MSFPLKLKLKTGTGLRTSSISTPSGVGTPIAMTPGIPSTPVAATPGGTIKIKFNTKSASTHATPVPATPAPVEELKKTKAGRMPKATAKKRQIKEEPQSDDEDSKVTALPAHKRIKLNTSIGKGVPSTGQTPTTSISIKAKVKGRAPRRIPGEGYDSEASDREDDPAIEEQFIFRMLPGEDCDYLRDAIINKKFGLPRNAGGPDIHMKFFHHEGRRATITIKGRIYAATLVDLPTITEGMKSWDKRGWWKSADICQMLWVFAQVRSEQEANTIELPSIIDPVTHQYPHGLTPPMQFARMRRFRKRVSRTTIEAVEDEVAALLRRDAEAKSSRYERINPDDEAEYSDEEDSEDAVGEEDAEGDFDDEEGYFGTDHHGNDGEVDAELAAELEADLEAEFEASGSVAATPISTDAMPMANGELALAEASEDSGDSSGEEEDDGGDGNGVDDATAERLRQIHETRESIAELEASIQEVMDTIARQQNQILRHRWEDRLRKLKAEWQLKKSSIGEDEDMDDEA